MRGKEEEERRKERERTYGIKYWGRMIPIKTPDMGALGALRLTSSIEELLPYHTIQDKTGLSRYMLAAWTGTTHGASSQHGVSIVITAHVERADID
eukprot:6205854-Pleurochrysis_carterae.AAC.2